MAKLLSRTSVFEAKLFTVQEDKVELPNGAIRTYHSVLRNSAVSVFPLDEDSNLYLIDQYRYLHEKRLIEGVAGMIEKGEEPLETAKRELMEEVGIGANEWIEIGRTKAAGSIVDWSQFLFVARDLEFKTAQPEESEDINVLKMPLSEAVQKVLKGEINTGSTSMGILMVDKLIQQGKL